MSAKILHVFDDEEILLNLCSYPRSFLEVSMDLLFKE